MPPSDAYPAGDCSAVSHANTRRVTLPLHYARSVSLRATGGGEREPAQRSLGRSNGALLCACHRCWLSSGELRGAFETAPVQTGIRTVAWGLDGRVADDAGDRA